MLLKKLDTNNSLFFVSTNIPSGSLSPVFGPSMVLKGVTSPSSVLLYTLILFSKTGSISDGGGNTGEKIAERPTNISSFSTSTYSDLGEKDIPSSVRSDMFIILTGGTSPLSVLRYTRTPLLIAWLAINISSFFVSTYILQPVQKTQYLDLL